MNEIKFDERGTGSKNVVWGRGVGEQEVPGVDGRWVREMRNGILKVEGTQRKGKNETLHRHIILCKNTQPLWWEMGVKDTPDPLFPLHICE